MANWWLVVFCFQLANVAKALHKVPKNISFQKKTFPIIFLLNFSSTALLQATAVVLCIYWLVSLKLVKQLFHHMILDGKAKQGPDWVHLCSTLDYMPSV